MAKQAILLLFLGVCIHSLAQAQMRVANYSYGEPGTDTYEEFSFWINNGKRTKIDYTYGKDRKETSLQFVMQSRQDGKSGFTVQFPNQYTLYILPVGNKLQVVDGQKKYRKTFNWYYEGPVNGIGTFCTVCAEDEKEAMRLLQTYYLK